MLIFFRIWQGLSAGAGAVVGRAVVGDLASGAEAHRAMSYMSVVFGLAPAIAPILGGWLLASSGWRSIFWFITTFTALLLLICFTSLPESLPAGKRQPFHLVTILKSYLEVGSHMRFMLRSASIALAFSGIMIYVVAAPDFIINILHLEVTDFGWLFLPLIGGMTVGSYLSGWLSHRVTGARLIRCGLGLMIAAAAMNIAYNAFFSAKIPWAVIPIFFYAFGICLAMPGMTVITLEMFPSMRGLAASMQTFFFMLMFSVLSGLIAPMVYGSPLHFSLLSVIGSLLGIGCWLLAALAPE
jgi:DHA1 family bicyclomycin/chloramphenicol resistance-like MFS transporter